MESSSSSSYSSSSSMVEMEDIEIPEIDSAFLMSLLQDSPLLDDQNVDQDDIRLMHVIQSLEAEISPIPVTYDDFSDTESSTASDECSGQSLDQMDGLQDCFMEDDIDLSWIDMEMVASLDCGDTGDMALWCTDESYVRDQELYNVDQCAQGYSYGVQMDQGQGYDYSASSWQQS